MVKRVLRFTHNLIIIAGLPHQSPTKENMSGVISTGFMVVIPLERNFAAISSLLLFLERKSARLFPLKRFSEELVET